VACVISFPGGTYFERKISTTPAQSATVRFRIPLLIPEGRWTDDGRRVAGGALSVPVGPPLSLMMVGDGAHGPRLVGRIDRTYRVENADGVLWNWAAEGEFLPGAEGAIDLIRHGNNGVGADVMVDDPDGVDYDGDTGRETISRGRIYGATMGPGYLPTFPDCRIELVDAKW